jgi:hypothetical protein
MAKSKQNAEVCDATDVDKSNAARYIKNIYRLNIVPMISVCQVLH